MARQQIARLKPLPFSMSGAVVALFLVGVRKCAAGSAALGCGRVGKNGRACKSGRACSSRLRAGGLSLASYARALRR